MHRFVLGLPPYRNGGLEVDHIDGNGLNNQRSNLRLVTHQQNIALFGQTRRRLGMRVCPTCGRAFYPVRDRIAYCSLGCRPQSHGPRDKQGRFA
jgi:hypothetical protein